MFNILTSAFKTASRFFNKSHEGSELSEIKKIDIRKNTGLKTHGMYKTKEYTAWNTLRSASKKEGIYCSEDWLTFDGFYKDMGNHMQGTFFKRIDKTKGYVKENCIWATSIAKKGRKGKKDIIRFNGKSQHLSAWAREIGVSPQTLRARLYKLGWAKEDALTVKARTCTSTNTK